MTAASTAGGRPSRRDDEGAYLVLYALLGVVFFTVAAVVLDIAALRQGRRSDRSAADLAATAGVAELDVHRAGSFARACEDAWGYVLANRTEAGGTVTPPDCGATFPSTDACSGFLAPRTATGTIGPLTISITHPVPDSSPLMLAEAQGGDLAQAVDVASDGTACERLGVRIVRRRTFLFARIAGAIGGTTDVHTVARALTATSTNEIPAIVALEPAGCGALVTDAGGGSLRVGGPAQAGLVIVDTDASGCGDGHAVDAGGAADATDRLVVEDAGAVTGELRSYALSGSSFGAAYDPTDVGSGRLRPRPQPAVGRTGRAILDARYHCATCPGGRDVIGPLEADRAGPGAPAGATVVSTCVIPRGPTVEVPGGHLYVDCDDFVVEGRVEFDAASVTFRGDVVVDDGGCLAVNDDTCGGSGGTPQDAIVYVRGSVTKATKGRLALPRTFVHTAGAVDIGVDEDAATGNSLLAWTAPLAGPFEDLLLWTETSEAITLGEQRTTSLVGTLFAPSSAVTLNPRNGGGVTTPLQLVARSVRLTGDGTYRLQPTADRATGAFSRQVRLIR